MTIKDLSAKTGYSVGTISRVLNDQPNVSKKAKQIILQAVEDSGFQLNANAKQLKQQHGNCVLAVVKGIGNEMFAELVEELQSRFAQLKYPLIVGLGSILRISTMSSGACSSVRLFSIPSMLCSPPFLREQRSFPSRRPGT